MSPIRNLALWLAAAIVMIAVTLMPSAASAHAGHGHEEAAVAAAELGPTSAKVATKADRVERRASKLEAWSPCSGCCCLSSGSLCSRCCSTGLMAAADPTWTAPQAGGPALARDRPMPPGIVPEALPEPPRPTA